MVYIGRLRHVQCSPFWTGMTCNLHTPSLFVQTNLNNEKCYRTIYAFYEQSVASFVWSRTLCNRRWSPRYHHRWLLIDRRMLSLRECKFHILASLMACLTALPQFSKLTTDNTLPTSLRTSASYDVWPPHKISMAGMVACNLYFLNSLFRQHIFSLSNVYRTKS